MSPNMDFMYSILTPSEEDIIKSPGLPEKSAARDKEMDRTRREFIMFLGILVFYSKEFSPAE